MANVIFSAGIDSVSGALSKPGKNSHACNKMLLATHRVAETTNPNCNRLYIRKKVQRATPVTAAELNRQSRFAAVAQAVNQRRQDATKIAQDQAAFNAQKNTAGGKKTMKAYLWKLDLQEYDNQ